VISGIGIVMFYRGLWLVLDEYPFFTGWVTLVIATMLLMLSGVFVSQFVSNHVILSGIKRDKKMVEKVGEQLKTDTELTQEVLERVKRIEEKLQSLTK
jgi:hypothetical protein